MARKSALRRLAFAAIAAALLAAGLLAAARWRASRLPAAEVPVLLWRAVAAADDPGDDAAAVGKSLFVDQVSDLWNGGFETVSPSRLRQYARWGRPLPEMPVWLRFAEPRADLVAEDGVEAILAGAGFEALVDLPCEAVEAGAPGLLSWDDVRAAAKRGTLRFAPCVSGRADASLSPEQARDLYRERVGRRADDAPPPDGGATVVLGGRHAFAVELRQDATDPAFFGTLAVSHPSGGNPPPDGGPFVLLVYQKDDPVPFVDAPLAVGEPDGRLRPAAPDETVRVPVPAAPAFPLDVLVYDDSRMVLYFRRTLFRNETKRDPSWRPPVLAPSDRLVIEPL